MTVINTLISSSTPLTIADLVAATGLTKKEVAASIRDGLEVEYVLNDGKVGNAKAYSASETARQLLAVAERAAPAPEAKEAKEAKKAKANSGHVFALREAYTAADKQADESKLSGEGKALVVVDSMQTVLDSFDPAIRRAVVKKTQTQFAGISEMLTMALDALAVPAGSVGGGGGGGLPDGVVRAQGWTKNCSKPCIGLPLKVLTPGSEIGDELLAEYTKGSKPVFKAEYSRNADGKVVIVLTQA